MFNGAFLLPHDVHPLIANIALVKCPSRNQMTHPCPVVEVSEAAYDLFPAFFLASWLREPLEGFGEYDDSPRLAVVIPSDPFAVGLQGDWDFRFCES
jgi:hypothetical protein